ncbi:MAG: transcription termination factor Rho [Akkermansiaceae bacterium]
MSDPTTQDFDPDNPELPLDGDAAATKKPAKKKAAKKKTARKAAKKTTKKTAIKAESADTPREEPKPSEDAPSEVNNTEEKAEEAPRMGRVKGLGPVKRNKAATKKAAEDNQTPEQDEAASAQEQDHTDDNRNRKNNRNHRNNNKGGRNHRNNKRERPPKREIVLTGEPVAVSGMLELAPKGFGFLRVPEKNFIQCKKDVFVPPDFVRRHGLRPGVWVHGTSQDGPRGPQLTEIKNINDLAPDEAFKLPHFEELKAVNPDRRIAFETTPERFTTRVLDIISPVGRGQRGLIVSPPRSGKTTLLLHMAEAIQEKYDESIHLIILLVDERPEEVTEFRRTLPDAEIYASSNDDGNRSHTRISEMCIERAKRLVEGGKDVLVLMDSITRLARAYNNSGGGGGGGRGKGKGKNRGYQSGGIVAGALEMPRRLFAAARNTRNAGSLTILATALIQTNSRADEAIFQEFKGTGNMELVLDRRIAEQYIYPAVDIFKSGTRREELIMAEHLLNKINLIRRGLAGHRPEEAMERLIFFLKRFPNNAQMLMEIKG